MSEQHFDLQMKQVLENLEAPYEAGSWALLERRLDGLVAEEYPAPVEPIDKMVYHTLERLEAPYQPAHWDMLAQRMQQQSLRIRRVRLTKVAEAAILLLLLANLSYFMGPQLAPGRPKPKIQRPDVPVAAVKPGQMPRHAKATGITGTQFMLTEPDEAGTTGTSMPYPVAGANTPADILSMDFRAAQSVSHIMQQVQQATDSHRDRIAGMVPTGELLPFNAFAALDVPARSAEMPVAPIRRIRSKGPVYFATFASSDQNMVLVNGARRVSSGYGAGVAVGLRKNKWGFETGVVYGSTSFEPQKQVEIYKGSLPNGYYGSTLTKAQTDFVSVPVKVNRQIARVGKTTARAVAGITTNFAVQKGYDYGTVFYDDPNPPSNLSGSAKPKLRKSGRGVLENGGLAGNVSASVDAGIRIEQPLGRGRYTAFIEPGFRQSLTRKGVGPNREPVNTLTLQAGVMAFL